MAICELAWAVSVMLHSSSRLTLALMRALWTPPVSEIHELQVRSLWANGAVRLLVGNGHRHPKTPMSLDLPDLFVSEETKVCLYCD